MPEIQLYQCFNAKVTDHTIYCKKGHKLLPQGEVNIRQCQRGDPLNFKVCQTCKDRDDREEYRYPVKKEDRGWRK